MNVDDAVDILLVEDDPQDARLTIRAMGKCNLANRPRLIVDGAEALDFLLCQGK
jgi:two-component system response regulator